MKRGILILVFLLSLVFASAKEIPEECIVDSSSDISLRLNDGPKVLMQKYINEQGNEEVLMFFYDENLLKRDDIGALKLILNYKKENNVYSFSAKNKEECEEEENCKKYYVKKNIPDICRRFEIEEIVRFKPIEEINEDLEVFDSCEDLIENSCPNSVFIRGMNSLYLFLKYKIKEALVPGFRAPLFSELNDCKKINIVVTGQDFNSLQDKERFKDYALRIINDGFLRNQIMKLNAGRFNFYLLDPGNDFDCEAGCLNTERALCCDQTKIMEKVSECPNDFVYVLVNSQEDAGSYFGNIGASTIGDFSPEVAEHELVGHGVGDLRDEYVDTYYDTIDEEAERNCYKDDSCRDWCLDQCIIGTGCYEGCERGIWYRAHRNSFMRNPGKEIGKYNEILICERIKEFTGYCEA